MMPHFTDLTGLAGVASAITRIVLLLPGAASLPKKPAAVILGSIFLLMLIPLGGMPLAAYVRGMTGDLSITTLVLLWYALLRPWYEYDKAVVKQHEILLTLITLTSVIFYPLALGFGAFDPYRAGYGGLYFVALLLAFTLAAWLFKWHLIVMCVALAVLAWSVGWYESDNLWDYLLDPFVSIYSLFFLAGRLVKRLVNLKRYEPHKI